MSVQGIAPLFRGGPTPHPMVSGMINPVLPPLGIPTLDIARIGAPSPGTTWRSPVPPTSGFRDSDPFDVFGFSTQEKGLEVPYSARSLSSGHAHFMNVGIDVFSVAVQNKNFPGSPLLLSVGALNQLLRLGHEDNMATMRQLIQDPEYANVSFLSEKDIMGSDAYEELVSKYVEDGVLNSRDTVARYEPSGTQDPNKRFPKRRRLLADSIREEEDKNFTLTTTRVNDRASMLRENIGSLERLSFPDVVQSSPSSQNLAESFASAKKNLLESMEKEFEESVMEDADFEKSRDFWRRMLYLKKGGLPYLYLFRLAELLKPLGVTKSTDFDDTKRPAELNRKIDAQNPVGVTVGGKSNCRKDVFGPRVSVHDKLFWVIKRAEKGGPFQIFPFSNGKELPKDEDVIYEDLGGETARGIVIDAGILLTGIGNNSATVESTQLAVGITTDDPREMYNNASQLPTVEALVKADYVPFF